MRPECSIPNCSRYPTSRGWCPMHYQRWQRYGDPLYRKLQRPERLPSPCNVEDCTRDAKARGWCMRHWKRWKATGDPMGTKPVGGNRIVYAPFEERFWSKVHKTETCWIWTGALTGAGYGNLKADGRWWCAHHISYILSVGPVPEGLELDHLCFNPPCVNPDHLEPVTHLVNVQRYNDTHR